MYNIYCTSEMQANLCENLILSHDAPIAILLIINNQQLAMFVTVSFFMMV